MYFYIQYNKSMNRCIYEITYRNAETQFFNMFEYKIFNIHFQILK